MDNRVSTLKIFHKHLDMFPVRQLFAVLVVAYFCIEEYDFGIHSLRFEARFFHKLHHLASIVVVQSDDDAAEEVPLVFRERLDLTCKRGRAINEKKLRHTLFYRYLLRHRGYKTYRNRSVPIAETHPFAGTKESFLDIKRGARMSSIASLLRFELLEGLSNADRPYAPG